VGASPVAASLDGGLSLGAAGIAAGSVPFGTALAEELAKQRKQVLFVWIDAG